MKRIFHAAAAVARLLGRVVVRLGRAFVSLLGPASFDWPGLRRWLVQVAALALLAGVGGFLVAASGIIPIKASSGHWPITAWLLNFSMERSVSLHSAGIKVPPLDDPALVLKGAGHYQVGCFSCHGSPQVRHPRVAQAMTPKPPYLAPPQIPNWRPEELFYIVKHGVKFTGMPAWPTQHRDDEVWAMVAFLQRFPELDAAEYRRLAFGQMNDRDVAPLEELGGSQSIPAAVRHSCARCHGVNGQGRGVGAFPILAGQTRKYLEVSLRAFAAGERRSGIMEPIAAGLSRGEIREAAAYYSNLAPPEAAASASELEASIERGAAIARDGIPSQRVPACAACHGPGDDPRNPLYPNLAGQYADYLVLQWELFKSRRRGGTDRAHLMHPAADGLQPEQMRDVARYYRFLP